MERATAAQFLRKHGQVGHRGRHVLRHHLAAAQHGLVFLRVVAADDVGHERERRRQDVEHLLTIDASRFLVMRERPPCEFLLSKDDSSYDVMR